MDKKTANSEVTKYITEKNKGGRPLKFKSPEELQKKIDEYFRSCYKKVYNKKTGEFLQDPETGEYFYENCRPLTIQGLCLHLKCDSETLTNYGNKPEFFETIMHTKKRIETFKVEALYNKDMMKGAKFDLSCNYGWTDTSKIEHAGNLTIEEIKYTK
jgi:hypothetical protein